MNIHEPGDLFQIDPDKDKKLGGQFIVATEIMPWGIQGYLLLDHLDDSLVRMKSTGAAYYRLSWNIIRWIGKVEWMINPSNFQKPEKHLV